MQKRIAANSMFRLTAWVVVAVILFCTLALASPLHQHDARNPASCTLNHFDDIVVCGDIADPIVLSVAWQTIASVPIETVASVATAPLPLRRGRAPPSFS